MNLAKILRRTKGIEPIVAAILLVVAAIVGGILLYLWISGMTSSATKATAITKPVIALWAGYKTDSSGNYYLNVTLKFPFTLSPTDVNRTLQEIECYYAINGTLANVTTSPVVKYISPQRLSQVFTLGILLGTNFFKTGTSYYCRIDLGELGSVVTPVFTVS